MVVDINIFQYHVMLFGLLALKAKLSRRTELKQDYRFFCVDNIINS